MLNRHELEIHVDACRRGRLSCRDKTHRMRRTSGERWENFNPGRRLRSQGAAISEAELIHFFQAQRFGAIGAGLAASLGAGPFVVE